MKSSFRTGPTPKQLRNPLIETGRVGSRTLHNLYMAYATGYTKEQGNLALGQLHPTELENTCYPGRANPLSNKEKNAQRPWKDRVGKYAPYFKDNIMLPIPELVAETEPKTLFFVTDFRTRRLAGLKKEIFGELLKTSGIPGRYYGRQSFTARDVLLPSEEQAVKLTGSNVSTKYFRLQPK